MVRNAVLGKMFGIFDTVETENESKKSGRKGKPERVVVNSINPALQHLLDSAVEYSYTAKLDGSCMLIRNGQLCKRRDLKAKKKKKQEEEEDEVDIPEGWFETCSEVINGHRIGFMPINPKSKEDKHMASTLSVDLQSVRVLVPVVEDGKDHDGFMVGTEKWIRLEELEGVSCEFLGPKSQGNLHGLESHFMVIHGDFKITSPPEKLDLETIREWVRSSPQGGVEGIVLHFSNGDCFKVHRHHLRLPWNEEVARKFVVKA